MSPKVRSGSPHADLLPRAELHPNDWNPNKLNAFQYAKLYESIVEYGFIDPLLVRRCPVHKMDWQIIDGEHRFDVGTDIGMLEFPVVVIDVDDATAQKLTLIANELHGQADPTKVGELLKGILEAEGPDELLKGLPYDEDILKGFLGFDPLPVAAPGGTPPAVAPPQPEAGAAKERWVERTYRLPISVAQVLDDALVKAQTAILAETGRDATPAEALEVLAAEYLGS